MQGSTLLLCGMNECLEPQCLVFGLYNLILGSVKLYDERAYFISFLAE